MGQGQQGQQAEKPRRAMQRWMLGPGAPDWLRRVWDERFRTVPRAPRLDPNRIRRITYL